VEIAALSVDPREDARTVVDELDLTFPLMYGLDCVSEAEKIGAYYESRNEFFHATNFLLRDGSVVQATYSSGPIGRMQAEHVAEIVEFYQNQEE